MEKKTAPNAVASLVLGIISIIFSCLPVVNLACGIIGVVLSINGKKRFAQSPDEYTGYGMLNAGFITSLIGIVLSALTLIYYIVFVLILGMTWGALDFANALNT